jgi:hypothetical protein
MGKDFLRLVELALTSGALVIPGYALAGDGTPPRAAASATTGATGTPTAKAKARGPAVRSARLDGRGLTIQFSEALRPTTKVDPSRFRLTFAYYGKTGSTGYAYYYEYYGRTRDVTVYDNVGAKVLTGRIEQPRPEQIRIPAAADLRLSSICEDLAARKEAHGHAGLYLHYDHGGSAHVEGVSGTALASIAPYWTANGDGRVTQGALAGRPIPVTVACPPAKTPPRAK